MSEKKKDNAFVRWTEKHAEIWKFIKFMIAGGGSSAVELVVHMVLLATVFKPFLDQPITNDALNMIGIESKGYLYTYLISTTVGYGIAFILNRKITFKADVNPTLSMILYAIMVVFTIFANGWIGSAMTTFAQGHNLTGGFWDMVIKLIGMAIPTLWTYPCNRFIIHRKKKPQTTATEKEEASFVVGEIKDLISKGVKEEAIAVLYRTNAQSRTIEEELLKKNIKYRVVGSFYFYNRKEIKDLLCYLRLINNHKDDVSLLRIINTPKRGIGEKTIDNLTTLAEDAGISIYEAITTGKELTFKELIEELTKDSEKMSLTELVDDILDKSGIRKELESSKLLEDEIRLENLNEFKGVTKSYEEESGSASLEDFLEEISLVSDITEHQDSDGRVSLMTVHSVKGLEFDYVFIVGMEEGIFPHYNAINDGSNSAIEEERRLCYVAITRAKKKLYITSADTRMLFGNTNRNMPSRFINEIDKEYIEVEGIKPLTKMVSNIKKKIDKNAEYTVGEHIVHTEFGEGVVIGVDKSILTVAFPHPTGIRKLMKGHPNIKKI